MSKIFIGVIAALIVALGVAVFAANTLRTKNAYLKSENLQLESALVQSIESFEQIKKAKDHEIQILTESLTARESVIRDYGKYQKTAVENEIECVNTVIDSGLSNWMLQHAAHDSGEAAGEGAAAGSSAETVHRF